MALGTKFQVVGTSDVYGRVTVNIKLEGYTGSVISLDGVGRDWINLKIGDNSSEISSPILAGKLTFSFYVNTDFQTTEIGKAEPFTYYVETLDSSNQLIWAGWAMPEEYSEAYQNTPYVATVSASDGLDELKNVSYPLLDGKATLFAHLRNALVGTFVTNKFFESVNIYSNGMNSTASDSPLTQAQVTYNSFRSISETPKAYEVLSSLLVPFFCRIYQYRGWRIENILEKRSSYIVREYNSAGVYVGQSTFNPLVRFDTDYSTFKAFIQKSGQLSIRPALNNAEVYFNTIEPIEPTTTGGFQEASDWVSTTELDQWNVVAGGGANEISIEQVPSSFDGNEFAVKIPGRKTSLELTDYIESDPVNIATADYESINVDFAHYANYPAVVILGSKPILYFEIVFTETSSGDVYNWNGSEWVLIPLGQTRRRLRIDFNDRMKWRRYSAVIDRVPSTGNIKFRFYKLIKSGSVGVTELRLTAWKTNLIISQPTNAALLLEAGSTNVFTQYKGPSFPHIISDGTVLNAAGVMDVSNILTSTWARRGVTESLNIRRLFLTQWLSFNSRPTEILSGTIHQKGEVITPMSVVKDKDAVSSVRYVMQSYELSLGTGIGSASYREIVMEDANINAFQDFVDSIRLGDFFATTVNYNIFIGGAPGLSPGANPGMIDLNMNLNGDVRGGFNQAEITPAAIQNKSRLDLTGLTSDDIVIGAVRDTPDQENMTNLRLTDIKPLITPDVGAGLSIDGAGKIQLGNDGAGVVDVIDSTVFPNGFLVKAEEVVSGSTYFANMYLANGDTYLQTAELNPVTGYNKFASLFSVPNASTISFNFTSGSPSNSGWAQLQNRLTTGFNPLVDDLESVHNIYDEVYNTGTGLSIVRNATTGVYTIKIFDERGQKGLVNDGDYESNFTARSLVTKQYVDNAISGAGHNPVTIGSPANGLSISGTQVLSLGLASAGVTGALSGTDWSTFNGKLNLTSPITGYTVGANTALAATDTILQAFGKVQGQINARISGTIASGQVAFGTGTNTVGGDAGFTYDSANDRFTIGGASLFGNNNNDFISIINPHIYASGSGGTVEPFQVTGNLILAPRTNAALSTYFVTNNGSNVNWRWRIISSGILESRESNTIVSRTGSLSFRSDGGNGSLFFTPNGTGGVCVGPATIPTNTLDVNGTARIRTISNLGTAATSVLVPSATGVVSLRTLAELAADGLGSKWTDVTGGIFRNGAVAIGRTTIPFASTFSVQSLTSLAEHSFYQILNNAGSLIFSISGTGIGTYNGSYSHNGTFSVVSPSANGIGFTGVGGIGVNPAVNFRGHDTNGGRILASFGSQTGGFTFIFYDGTIRMPRSTASDRAIRRDELYLNYSQTVATVGTINDLAINADCKLLILTGATDLTGVVPVDNTRLLRIEARSANRIIRHESASSTAANRFSIGADLTINAGEVYQFIYTDSRWRFINDTRDQFAVKTTASADQTLPSGTLTILDYDTTVINNSTPTYTVATDGRITINTTGIYTITAGVVVEANAVTALESAFLGIFRNGDLVAISSINTTIAAGAQSGLTTSTILSLTATDIIDCRALVNSVGGVANGLARRLGTLLGANATQVNSLSITKNSQ